MFEKIKKYFGLDEKETISSKQSSGNLIEIKLLQDENRKLRNIIKKQNTLLQELSEDNMELGRERRRLVDIVASQRSQIEIYENLARKNYQ